MAASETLRVGGVRGQGQEALPRTPSPTVGCWLCCLAAQLCFTLCDPVDCSPPGSSVHGILRASILEWVPTPFSRGFSGPRDQTHVSCTAGRFFTTEPLGKPSTLRTDANIGSAKKFVQVSVPSYGKTIANILAGPIFWTHYPKYNHFPLELLLCNIGQLNSFYYLPTLEIFLFIHLFIYDLSLFRLNFMK